VRPFLLGSNATLTVQTDITNQSALAASASLTSTILDANSNAVASASSTITVPAGQDLVVTQTVAVANAHLWSPQTPYLYNMVSTVSNQNAIADVYNTPFGVRTVRFDPTNGVFINGQHVEIQGMCNHQDHAGVGSALPDRLQYFRIEKLRQMGVNAYRTSHNTPTPELLNACDQLGMLVLDENRRVGWDRRRWASCNARFCATGIIQHFLLVAGQRGSASKRPAGRGHHAGHAEFVTRWIQHGSVTAALNSWGSGFSSVVDVQVSTTNWAPWIRTTPETRPRTFSDGNVQHDHRSRSLYE